MKTRTIKHAGETLTVEQARKRVAWLLGYEVQVLRRGTIGPEPARQRARNLQQKIDAVEAGR